MKSNPIISHDIQDIEPSKKIIEEEFLNIEAELMQLEELEEIEGEIALREARNITINGITLFFKDSLIVDNDLNNARNEADFRIDYYKINHIISGCIQYYELFNMIKNHIVSHIFKVMPTCNKPIKYTILIEENKHEFGDRRNNSDFEIYLPNTIGKTKPLLLQEVNKAIHVQGYSEYDWIYPEDRFETLIIIQERLTVPRYYSEPDPNENQVKLSKTFKEDNCVVCMTNKPNILFCNCGHLCICEECFDRLDNKTNCLKCRKKNTIIRKI